MLEIVGTYRAGEVQPEDPLFGEHLATNWAAERAIMCVRVVGVLSQVLRLYHTNSRTGLSKPTKRGRKYIFHDLSKVGFVFTKHKPFKVR